MLFHIIFRRAKGYNCRQQLYNHTNTTDADALNASCIPAHNISLMFYGNFVLQLCTLFCKALVYDFENTIVFLPV